MICVQEKEYVQEFTAILDSKQFPASGMGSNSDAITAYYSETLQYLCVQKYTSVRFHQEEHRFERQ